MKPTITVLTCLLLLGIARADVAEIESQFRSVYELNVGKQFREEVAALDAKYLGALERAMQTATQGGKLEEALVFEDEIQRLKEKGPLPEKDDGVTPALLKLRTTYRDQFNKLLAARKTAIAPIVEKFAAALAAHQEELTKAAKLAEAVAVKTYREGDLSQRLTGDALAISLTAATVAPEKPFENSLRMRFVPVPIVGGPSAGKTVRFSIWETRVKDYAEFVKDTKREWRKPSFDQDDDHPAVHVSWDDATAFCDWLTKEERRKRKIGAKDVYRLPTDHEWSCAVGIGKDENPTSPPSLKTRKIEGYPWGVEFPPPRGAGNFLGEESKGHPFPGQTPISGYDDGFVWTAPVGDFAPNQFGLFDIGGNVAEWCQDFYAPEAARPVRCYRGHGYSYSNDLFSSMRSYVQTVDDNHSGLGFRVVLEVAPAN